MSTPDTPPPSPTLAAADLHDESWQQAIGRPLLVIALALCLWQGMSELALAFMGDRRLLWLWPLGALAVVQVVYTRYWLADPRRRRWRGWSVEVSELAVMLIALRVLTWVLFGQRFDAATLRMWFLNPFTFFDLPFVLGGVMVVIIGRFAAAAATNVLALGLRPDELVDYRQLGQARGWVQAAPPDREALLEAFGETWMLGGVVLLVCVALSRGAGQLGEPGWWRWDAQGLTPTAVLALVGYLLTGLLLFSQGRLALLRARWRYEGVPGGERVLARWHRHATGVILLVALLALLLPLGSTFGLATVLLAVIRAAILLATLIVGLMALLMTLALNLFTPETTPVPPPELPPLEAIAPPSVMAWGGVPPWVGPGVFWLLLLMAAGYFLLSYARRWGEGFWPRWPWWQRLRSRRPVRWRGLRLPQLRRSRGQPTPVSTAAAAMWRYVRLRGLSPTERTRYFYLSTVRRAGQLGTARRPHQTPLEYEQTLRREWPEVETDLHELTTSFLHARYGPQPVDEEEAGRARRAWEHIKRLWRKRDESQIAHDP
ncbi:MAG: DUF4129 domain-containing protein [Caldilineales bacterium]|nr:DUF4129 domain-containing protein [Caldilineales bacterium]